MISGWLFNLFLKSSKFLFTKHPPFHNIKQISEKYLLNHYSTWRIQIHTQKGASMAEKKTYEPLDDLLDSSGLKYKVIAKKINVPYTTFYKWRINPSRIDAVSAANIAEVIGVDLTDVIFVLKNFNQKLDKLAS
ncbi:hypothetical protein D6111_08645 [Lactococcus lactis]|nr:hypothetical protein D6109_06565 [Lactococcus lactis]RQE04546.1 hypothetical protein D6107_04130 [Lactococcus lactis]RQE07357.1 hypothetical protein D6110_06255 [Lactococcus lactis]RQE11105.1 hypothetical protein D6108_03500 [Lactococcus lactis]RQE13182.1 hypothetical protein D6113_06940 [Lactococcus lactis]